MPTNNVLLNLTEHISNMIITSSPGFDTITPTFIKCAHKRVPKRHGRGSENVNVMAPHIAALFRLLIKKANIPRSGKRPSCTLRILILHKCTYTIRFLETSCGITEACTTLISTRCWMETKEQMCKHHLVSNKGAPSPPYFFHE
jgi:hypothetical protein